MRKRDDPAWKRYYDVCGRAMLLLWEGRITTRRYAAIHEAAR
jgi:hypothetical protein